MNCLLKIFSILSLSTINRLGALLGYGIYCLSSKSRKHINNNLRMSGLANDEAHFKALKHANIKALGIGAIETLAIFKKDEPTLLSYVNEVHGWHHVEAAYKQGKGAILLTPHLGCFEMTSIYYGSQHPITVMFRPPKLQFLGPIIEKGRSRTGVSLAEANASGVRKVIQALKRGEAIGILPDQVPNEGEGEWADFFGHPAYTMSLASKLANKTGAPVVMAFGERLADGKGFDIHFTKVDSIATATLLNEAIEKQVAQNPAQYLWSYNRYKQRSYALSKPGAPTK
jgi:KDO2-lipid IV(A) lauroyltransferase